MLSLGANVENIIILTYVSKKIGKKKKREVLESLLTNCVMKYFFLNCEVSNEMRGLFMHIFFSPGSFGL